MEKGYSATSMRSIAQEVGLLPSSLYSHITSKEEILFDICFNYADVFLKALDTILAESKKSSEALQEILMHHIEVTLEDPASVCVFNDDWRHLSEPGLSEFVKLRRSYEVKLLDIIDSGVSKGEFKNLDSKNIHFAFLALLRGIHLWIHPNKVIDRKKFAQDMKKIFFKGILKIKK